MSEYYAKAYEASAIEAIGMFLLLQGESLGRRMNRISPNAIGTAFSFLDDKTAIFKLDKQEDPWRNIAITKGKIYGNLKEILQIVKNNHTLLYYEINGGKRDLKAENYKRVLNSSFEAITALFSSAEVTE